MDLSKMSIDILDRNDGLDQLLDAFLGAAPSTGPTSSRCALPAPACALQTGNQKSSSTELPFGEQLALAQQGTRQSPRATSSKGSKGVRRRVQQMELSVYQQQQELRQQVHKNLYLTERVALLEQLVTLHELYEARVAQVHSGQASHPFAAWNLTVEEAMNATPAQWAQTHNHVVQCLAKRLASVTPLLQKYPQLATYRPPTEQLQVVVQELSLAEPTNPYGAHGLPLGTLTVPVPAKVLHQFAAAYGMDINSMAASELTMLENCAVMVVEQACVCRALMYGLMLPSAYCSPSVHIGEFAAHSSWESFNSSLSGLAVEEGSSQGRAAAAVAEEAHWHEVVKRMELTDKQKLQTSVLWELIDGARSSIQVKRAKQARALLSIISLSGPADTPSDVERKEPSPAAAHMSHTHVPGFSQPAAFTQPTAQPQRNFFAPFTQPTAQLQRNFSAPVTQPTAQLQWNFSAPVTQACVQRACSISSSATAAYRLTPEQLTQQEALMQRLENSIAQERSLIGVLGTALTSNILSPVQLCKLLVHSYPYKPCRLNFLSACAVTCTPAVMDALAAEATASHELNK